MINISTGQSFTSSNLPLVIITTNGQTIQNEERIIAHMGIINNGVGERNNISDFYNDFDGRIAIELRGSSSLQYPKKQYRLETQDSFGENLNVSILGLPKENDWILNGPYNDKSLIRNVLSYKLSNNIGRYASRTVYCELVLDGNYQGLYILMEKIKRDKNRVSVSKLTSVENTGDELTGGYIIKIDKMDGENIDFWESDWGTKFQYHYPKPNEITISQKNYIQNLMSEFESVMDSENYANPVSGYPKYIDVNSFVDHFILNEFCKNVDAYRLSAFLYKDRDSINNKLFAGPIWDFNLTFGDAWNEEDMFITEGWQVDYSIAHPNDWFKVPFWWSKLSRDSEFINSVNNKWNELRKSLLSVDSLFYSIDSIVTYIDEARMRNFERWTDALDNTYQQEILILKDWIVKRINWIDANISKLTNTDRVLNFKRNSFQLFQNYPNPFNPSTTIKYSIPHANNFMKNSESEVLKKEMINGMYVQIKVFDILGREVTTLVNEVSQPGSYQVQFDASSLTSGMYFYELRSENYRVVKKMLLLR